MCYITSYLLTPSRPMPLPSAKDIKKILDSMSIEADDGLLDKVTHKLTGESSEDPMAQGIGKLAGVPAGGAVAVHATSGPAAPAAGSTPAAAEEKKDEKKELEELDDDMRFDLFHYNPALLQIKPFLHTHIHTYKHTYFKKIF
uniref:Large ribosomal subunit protein P2 n=1 Tax=Suricata suricatta TaxID=37032 RepID=A0A673UF61_SURSU